MKMHDVRGAMVGALAFLAGCASHSGGNPGAADRISASLQRLGATADRGDCYADKIANALPPDEAEEAAAIADGARSKEDMREGVLSASAPVRRAFISAKFRCGGG